MQSTSQYSDSKVIQYISKDDLINGFIRDIQSLLPYKENPYYIIQKDIIIICKSYIFWYQSDEKIDIIAHKNIYIDPVIIKQTQLFDNQLYLSPLGESIQIMLNRFSYVLLTPLLFSTPNLLYIKQCIYIYIQNTLLIEDFLHLIFWK